MYGFWYDYIKPKYQDKAKLCYMDTDSIIIHIKTEDLYEYTANSRLMFENYTDCLFNDKIKLK